MAQRNVLQQPKHGAQTNRNWFDLSHHVIFSDSIGLLSPVACFETIPNEHYKISIDSFCRSQAVNTSSFMRVKEQYDVFAVPLRLLWSYSDVFFSQVTNYSSFLLSMNTQKSAPVRTPLIDVSAFAQGGQVMARSKEEDEFGIIKQFGFDRIFNQLEYGIWQTGDDPGETQTFLNDNFARNPFRAAAYQKIYHDYFQNTDYEDIPIECYNLDYSPGGVIAGQSQYLADLFRLRYRDLRKDALTVIKPSFNIDSNMPYLSSALDNLYYGTDQLTSNSAPEKVLNLFADNDMLLFRKQSGSSSSSALQLGHDSTSGALLHTDNDDAYFLSAQNIRAVLAFDRLNQNIGLGGRDYRSQIESRFGVKLPQLRSDKCIYLGSFDGSVVVSEVLATNGDDLGQIGGKGTGSVNGRQIEFDSLEHSIIMVIHSFLPYTDYYSEMIDRHNTKSEFLDYFQPELDNLGAQPVYGYELSSLESLPKQHSIVGFAPRFIEDKSKLNKVFGSKFSNEFWTAIHRAQSPATKGYAALKVNPKDFDSQFGIAFDGTTATDQFICRAMINCTKLSPMSVYGLPNYQ